VVLHHITNDPKLIEVPASAVCTKRLLECYENISNVVAVPDRLEDGISKPKVGRRRSNDVVRVYRKHIFGPGLLKGEGGGKGNSRNLGFVSPSEEVLYKYNTM